MIFILAPVIWLAFGLVSYTLYQLTWRSNFNEWDDGILIAILFFIFGPIGLISAILVVCGNWGVYRYR